MDQPRQSPREAVTCDSHYFFGRRYRLEVIQEYGRHRVEIKNNRTLQLFVRPGTITKNRMLVINEWYRDELKAYIPALLKKWQKKIGVEVSAWGVKKMRTRWGSCTIQHKRIWLNLELAKKPPESSVMRPFVLFVSFKAPRAMSWSTCSNGATMKNSERLWESICHHGNMAGIF